ncbi:MAG: phosphonate ABC transporter permease [Bradyrhizobiaceae bacterium]|nr:MAG: phosphonate ABC transporter permease [Bradyrhizobiaceae bacterium]
MAVHFSVDTKLTKLLGETYRSSEVALKELVDNAWDADARTVKISLPDPLSGDSVVVQDDGTGMTAAELRDEYLNIASDKVSRIGKETPGLRRRVKGRKGIGKFAGLTIAGMMRIDTVKRDHRCTLVIDKKQLVDNPDDLESIPLSFEERDAKGGETGTTVTLSHLDDGLNFPTPDRLREILIYEYGREDSFRVFVNGVALSVDDVPGETTAVVSTLPSAGNLDLKFTVAEGKKLPRSPGIIVKVGGKAVGKPQLFGLDEDDEVPAKLARRIYGEAEVPGIEKDVTADWGGVIENSKAFLEAQAAIRASLKKALRETYQQEMSQQKARLQRQIEARLRKLPENRRRFANDAIQRILVRFYGDSTEKIETIVEVALDAMEQDAYWEVLDRINKAKDSDVESFAEALEQFGILELSMIGVHARHRRTFLDGVDRLIQNPATLEKDAHKAFQGALWMLGRNYSMMSSNLTLKTMIESYCDQKFKGNRAAKRPDLLLSQDYGDSYLLIEFKRPSHSITRDDIAQAEKYRDDLAPRLASAAKFDIMLIGKGRVESIDANQLPAGVLIHSYVSILSAARFEMDWLIASLAPAPQAGGRPLVEGRTPVWN